MNTYKSRLMNSLNTDKKAMFLHAVRTRLTRPNRIYFVRCVIIYIFLGLLCSCQFYTSIKVHVATKWY